MNRTPIRGAVLIVGGAGFVGSNLAHTLLGGSAVSELWIVDNLLSSDVSNVPTDRRVRFLRRERSNGNNQQHPLVTKKT